MDTESKRILKAQAHNLKPVVMIGQAGLTDAVITEINIALDCHELIKIKIRADKDVRFVIGEEVCAKSGATHIQTIGQIAVIYRKNPPSPVKAKEFRRLPNKLKTTKSTKKKLIAKRRTYLG